MQEKKIWKYTFKIVSYTWIIRYWKEFRDYDNYHIEVLWCLSLVIQFSYLVSCIRKGKLENNAGMLFLLDIINNTGKNMMSRPVKHIWKRMSATCKSFREQYKCNQRLGNMSTSKNTKQINRIYPITKHVVVHICALMEKTLQVLAHIIL